jgi:hypothetical protein
MSTPGFPNPRNWQFWNNISATPELFNLDAGAYGLTLTATFGTVALQKALPTNPATFVTVATVTSAGYTEINLPAGQYQLTLTGVTGLIGEIAKIASGSG